MQYGYPRADARIGQQPCIRHVDDHPDARRLQDVPPERGPVRRHRVLVRRDEHDVSAVPHPCKGPFHKQHVRVVPAGRARILLGKPLPGSGPHEPAADVRRAAHHAVERVRKPPVPPERVRIDIGARGRVHERVAQADRIPKGRQAGGAAASPPRAAQEQAQAGPVHRCAVRVDPKHVLRRRPGRHAAERGAAGDAGRPATGASAAARCRGRGRGRRPPAPFGADRPRAARQERPRPAHRVAHAHRGRILAVPHKVPHQRVRHEAGHGAGRAVRRVRQALRAPAAARPAPRIDFVQVQFADAAEYPDVKDRKVVPLQLRFRRVQHADHPSERIVRDVQAIALMGREQACAVRLVEPSKLPAQAAAYRHVAAAAAPRPPARLGPFCQRHENRLGHAPVLERPHKHQPGQDAPDGLVQALPLPDARIVAHYRPGQHLVRRGQVQAQAPVDRHGCGRRAGMPRLLEEPAPRNRLP